MRKLMITFLLALGCSSAMATQLYKWVDENGVTQFSQQPPPDSQYQRMNVAPVPELGAPAQPNPPVTSDSSEPATNDVSPAVDEAAAKAELEAYCASQRNRLTTMENNPRLSRTLPDGTVERIGEDERQAMIAETRSDLQKYCQD